MAGTEKDKNTIQTGLKQNAKEYNEFGYFLNGIDVTDQNLDTFLPYIQGVSRFFIYKVPVYMNKLYPGKTTNWKSYMETGYTRIDGINDVSVDFVEFEGGFAGQRFKNVSIARDDTDTITVTVYEQSGSPVREYIETWITGVRDPRSGIAHYHGAIASETVPYSEKNHTAEFVYYDLDPTGTEIEYGCLLAHAFPTKVPKSHLNYEKGERGNVSLDLEFSVTKYESTYVNDLCKKYLAIDKIKWNYLDFDPGVDAVTNEMLNYNLNLG